ncbi:MAG: succinate dehydrogenase [Rhodospirillales bacterium]|nr:MAG: succinate dehydrogenase [Rhodospirillales bacterium]
MMSVRLFLAQRLTALILAPLVLVHLGVIIYAVRSGLSAEEILGRTRGSLGWALFYGGFAVAVAAHGAIGLRTVILEWGGLRPGLATAVAWAAALILLALGLRGVWAVTAGGGL